MNIKECVTGMELDVLREAVRNHAGYLTDNAYRYRMNEGPSPRVENMEREAQVAKGLVEKLKP